MIGKLLGSINTFRARRLCETSRYRRAMSDIPPSLYAYWKSTARHEFKGIPSDAFFFVRATEGLLTFFDCVRSNARPCALPSAAADSVWHAWSRMAPAQLARFCRHHFGGNIPHTEADDMNVGMAEALANSLTAARRLDALPVAGAGLPRLFALDRSLNMPHGYAYSIAMEQVAFRNMDSRGAEYGKHQFPAALAPIALLEAGLISLEEYDMSLKNAHPDGSGCGAGCGSTSSDGGGGGSCGGGCGGD
ncbi:MAG: hypothetical protein V4857_10890 [Pseudomonadota bacterium]